MLVLVVLVVWVVLGMHGAKWVMLDGNYELK